MHRVVLPEFLDSLPPDHADARVSRRDIGLFNLYLGTLPWFVRILKANLKGGESLLEIGAGEGKLVGSLCKLLNSGTAESPSWTALDRSPVFNEDDRGIHFVAEDLLHFDGYNGFDVIFGNMILHQFTDAELSRIGAHLCKSARLLVFQETLRLKIFYALCLLVALPLSRVSRHDALVSIRAGFRNDELPQKMGLDPRYWRWETTSTLRGAYRMIARRK